MSKFVYALQVPISFGFQEVFFDSKDLALLYAKHLGIENCDILDYPLYWDRNDFSIIDKDFDYGSDGIL